MKWCIALATLLCVCHLAPAQDGAPSVGTKAEDEEKITVSLTVNYGSAFRNASWVPVDILVNNTAHDLTGHIEVRTMNAIGDLQSPIYRLPAESPKDSRKRFRFHCRMEDTSEIEARLYHQNRLVNQARVSKQVQPIAPEDFLCLVLDDTPEDYGFLRTQLYTGNTNVRLHLESLSTLQLGLLSDYPQCYSAFDLIVMGDIEPGRIAESHRELLRGYVEQGGVLVVSTGAQAENYRGAWIEELLGVAIGQESYTSGLAIAQAVFPPAQQSGAQADRTCAIAELSPAAEQVQTLGDASVLATLRRYGSGFAAAIAIDSKSRALQECEGYLDLWRELCARKAPEMTVSLNAAVRQSRESLIGMAGVQLLPKSTVVTYLLLYFLVGVVANWIFWSLMKRREMAWVCLVLFSFGFTAFAAIFGTAGRAQRTEIERIDVLRLQAGSAVASLDAIAGVLTAGTGQYAGSLLREDALLSDFPPDSEALMMGRRGLQALTRQQPFVYIQEEPPRFEELQIGASDMRMIHADSQVALEGPISGALRLEEGQLRGEFENRTGLPIRAAALLHEATLYPLSVDGAMMRLDHYYQPNLGVHTGGSISEADLASATGRFQELFFQQLVRADEPQAGFGPVPGPPQPAEILSSVSPAIIAWIQTPPADVFAIEGQPIHNLELVVLLARVDWTPPAEYQTARYLPFKLTDGAAQGQTFNNVTKGISVHQPFSMAPDAQRAQRWTEQSRVLTQHTPIQLEVRLPAQFARYPNRQLWLEVFNEPNPHFAIQISAVPSANDLAPVRQADFDLDGQALDHQVYDLLPAIEDQPDWQETLELLVYLLPRPDPARGDGAGQERRESARVGFAIVIEDGMNSEGMPVAWK